MLNVYINDSDSFGHQLVSHLIGKLQEEKWKWSELKGLETNIKSFASTAVLNYARIFNVKWAYAAL